MDFGEIEETKLHFTFGLWEGQALRLLFPFVYFSGAGYHKIHGKVANRFKPFF